MAVSVNGMAQRLVAAAQKDLLARIASGEIDAEHKRKKLLDVYVEELFVVRVAWVEFARLFGCGGRI